MRDVRIHRRVFTLLICLSIFIAACGLSLTVSAGAGKIIDQYSAWYEIFRYLQLIMAVTVEIKTGTRRIISYLLSPLARYRQEALRER